jgi:hypothetical protein
VSAGGWEGPALTLVLLGAFHGLNPAMGWLFAVALGLQQGRRSGVLRAIPPIALGHLVSIALVVALVAALQRVIPPIALRLAGGAALLALGGWMVARRRGAHPRWVGMRVGARDLALWSFLVSTAHGAGLMLVPVVLGLPADGAAAEMRHAHPAAAAPLDPEAAAIAVAIHAGAMLAVMAAVAALVYEVVGLDLLRRVWLNLDVVWGAALLIAGLVTILM